MGVKVKKAVGVVEFDRKEFPLLGIPAEWFGLLGELPTRFTISIYGESGNGKSDLAMKLAKLFGSFDKVYYNSVEQGISKSLQMCIRRNNMHEVKGQVTFGCDMLEELIVRLEKRKSARFVILDSRDQMNLTDIQFLELEKRFPKKSFIILMYEEGAKPKGAYGDKINFRCDIKIRVARFVAYPVGRYGGITPFTIWDEGARKIRERIKEWKQLKKADNEKS